MRIQPVNNGYYVTNLNSGNKNSKNTVQNSFISFGINWNKTKLDILNKNPHELREIAEYFHKSCESELREITGFYKLRKNREKAYGMLTNAIELIKLQKDNWLLHLSILDKQNLTESEQAAKLDYENRINDLDNKFKSRIMKFEDKAQDFLKECNSQDSSNGCDSGILDSNNKIYKTDAGFNDDMLNYP